MRKPVLLAAIAALSLLPAAARAQITPQDPADSFSDSRTQHLERMDQNPEKWWGGDMSDRPGATSLSDSHEFNPTARLYTPGSDSASPAIPGNPSTVRPLFSADEMNEAGGEVPIDFSNPADVEQAARQMGARALGLFGGENEQAAPGGPEQPFGAQQPPPVMVRQDGPPLTAAAPKYVPADPQPAIAPPARAPEPAPQTPLSPPPVQDEAGAMPINPADAPALADPAASGSTTTAIPPLEDPATLPAADAPPALTP